MDERAKDFLDIATSRPGSMTRDQNKHSGVQNVHLENGFGTEVIRFKKPIHCKSLGIGAR